MPEGSKTVIEANNFMQATGYTCIYEFVSAANFLMRLKGRSNDIDDERSSITQENKCPEYRKFVYRIQNWQFVSTVASLFLRLVLKNACSIKWRTNTLAA